MAAEQSDDGARAGARFASDAMMVNARRGRLEGREAITRHWTEAFGAQPGSAGTRLDALKWGASGDLAYVLGRYTSGVTMPGTDGHFITVTERQPDGSLRIVAQMSIPDAQAPR